MAGEVAVPFDGGAVRVYDADTTYTSTDTGESSGDRLLGIDAPEMKNRDPDSGGYEEAGAGAGRDRLEELLTLYPDAKREVVETDQYGRNVVRYVTPEGTDLNAQLVREGHASSYDFGGSKSPYAEEHFQYLHDLRRGAMSAETGDMQLVRESTSDPSLTREVGKGWRRGISQTQGFLNYGMSQMAEVVGMPDMAAAFAENAEEDFQDAAKYEPTVGSWKEAKETGNYATWVAGLFGEQAPQMAVDLGVGVITGGSGAMASFAARRAGFELMAAGLAKSLSFSTGAAASQYTQMVGSVAQELKANGINDPKTAMLYALPATGLDYLSLKSMLGTAGRLAKNGRGETAAQLVAGVLKNSAFEGGTEAAQEFIAKTAVASHKSDFDVFSEENIDDYVESFMAGFAVGGAFSTPAAAAGALSSRKIEKQNQQILGYDEAREDIGLSGEDAVVVTTRTPDGARTQEAARASNAESVGAKQRASMGEGAQTVFESPQEEVMRRQTEGAEFTQNRDHVQELPEDVAADIFAVATDRKQAALSDKKTTLDAINSMAPEKKEVAVDKLDVIETADDRVIVVNKANEKQAAQVREVLDNDGVEYDEVGLATLLSSEGYSEGVSGFAEPIPFGEGYTGQSLPLQETDVIDERARVTQPEPESQEEISVAKEEPDTAEKTAAQRRLLATPEWAKEAIPFAEGYGKESHEKADEITQLREAHDAAKAEILAADLVNDGSLSERQKRVIEDYFLKAIASDEISPNRKRIMIDALDADFDFVMDEDTVQAMLGKEAAAEIEATRTDRGAVEKQTEVLEPEERAAVLEKSETFGEDIRDYQREQLEIADVKEEGQPIENYEEQALVESVKKGAQKAVSNRMKTAVMKAKESEFARFGYANREDFKAFKKRVASSSKSTFTAAPDIVNAQFVSADGKKRLEIYMPDAVMAMLHSGSLDTTSDRNLDQRALDAFSAIVGHMALRPEMFYLENKDAEQIHVLNKKSAKLAKQDAKIGTRSIEDIYSLPAAEVARTDAEANLFEQELELAKELRMQRELPVSADPRLEASIRARVSARRDKVKQAMDAVSEAEAAVKSAQIAEREAYAGETRAQGEAPVTAIDREEFDTSTEVDAPIRLKKDTKEAFSGAPAKKREPKETAKKKEPKAKVVPKESPFVGVSKEDIPLRLRTALRDAIVDSGIQTKLTFSTKIPEGMKSLASVEFTGERSATIYLNSKKLEQMPGSQNAIEIALMHELGHVFVAETMHNIDRGAHILLNQEFQKARKKVPNGHPYKKQGGVGYDEWLADQFGAYIRGKQTSVDAASLFDKVKRALAKFVNALSDHLFGRERVAGSATGLEFMHSMFEHGLKGKPLSVDDKFSEWTAKFYVENAAKDRTVGERRAAVAALATGRKIVPNEAAPRDMTVLESTEKATDIGKVFVGNMYSAVRKPARTTRRLLQGAASIANSATFLRTADGELRTMGAAGVRIANRYKKMIAGTNADLHIWTARADALLKKIDKNDLEAFAKGEKQAPPPLKKFFQDMYKYAKKDIKDLGFVEHDFVPRFFNRESIEQRKAEFAQLLLDQAEAAGFDMTLESAFETASTIIKGDSLVSNYIEERSVLAGPTLQHKKARNLHFMDDAAMREAGFLVTDPSAVMASYINHVVRRANYEKQFAGYNKLGDEDEVKKSTKGQETAANFVIYNALMHNPVWKKDGSGKWYLMNLSDKEAYFTKPNDKNFMDKNKQYIDQLSKRGVLQEPSKDKHRSIGWAYYDQNKHMRRDAAYMDRNQIKRLMTITDAYSGRLGADAMPYKLRKLQSNVIAYENLTVMAMSVFAQFADMAGMVFRNRDMEGAFDALNEMRKLLFTAKGKERRELMADLGFAERQLSMQAILEAQGLQFQTEGARKVNEFLFKYNGVQGLTNITRTATAAIAERFISRHAAKAEKGDARSRRYLDELGISVEDAKALSNPDFQHYRHYVELGDVGENASKESKQAEAVHKAIFAFTDSAVVRPDASQRPVWASDPRFAIIWHLKSFMYAYGHTIIKGLYKEMNTRWKEKRESGDSMAAAVGDAAVPLLIYTAPVFALSALGLELREKVQYELWGGTPPTEKMDMQTYMFEVLKRGGIMGAGELGYSFVEASQRGQSGVAQIMGPTVSHLELLLEMDLAKSAARSTPLVNQIPPIRDWYKGFFGG